MTSAKDRMRARIAQLTDAQIVSSYAMAARLFAVDPAKDTDNALIITMGFLDYEILQRGIPACEHCSVPTAANWHDKSLHEAGPVADLAEALTGMVVKAATV